MLVVTLASAVLTMVAIVRGCLVGRLRLSGVRSIGWSRLHGRSL